MIFILNNKTTGAQNEATNSLDYGPNRLATSAHRLERIKPSREHTISFKPQRKG